VERDATCLTWRKSSYSSGSGNACVEVATWRKSSHSGASGNACVEVAGWRKSSHSSTSGDACVEVADTARVVLIRDTTDRDGPVLCASAETWHRFTATLRWHQ
jgi:hypothetical protein